jgi:hypothetical protein
MPAGMSSWKQAPLHVARDVRYGWPFDIAVLVTCYVQPLATLARNPLKPSRSVTVQLANGEVRAKVACL